MDEPYTREYKVDFLIPNKLIRIDFKLGFRVEQQINVLFRMVVEDLVNNHEVEITSKYRSLNKYQIAGDFRFIVLEKVLSRSNKLPFLQRFIMEYYFILKRFALSEERGFGLDISFVSVERVPLIVSTAPSGGLKRIQ